MSSQFVKLTVADNDPHYDMVPYPQSGDIVTVGDVNTTYWVGRKCGEWMAHPCGVLSIPFKEWVSLVRGGRITCRERVPSRVGVSTHMTYEYHIE